MLAPCVPPVGPSTLLGPRTCFFLGLVGQFREIKRFSKIAKKVCPEHGGPLSALRAGWTSPVADEKKKIPENILVQRQVLFPVNLVGEPRSCQHYIFSYFVIDFGQIMMRRTNGLMDMNLLLGLMDTEYLMFT